MFDLLPTSPWPSGHGSRSSAPTPPTFAALVESRRNRRDDWYEVQAGYIDLCNVPIAVRPAP